MLRRPTGAVWLEGDEDDASILRLWVGFQAMAKMRQPQWPLLKGDADFFAPIPYGTDNRLRQVKITLFENNVVVGAIPGAGKSASIRTLVLGAALDPTVELRLWSLKQNDFAALERISHTFGYGLTDDVIEGCLADLAAVKKGPRRQADPRPGQPPRPRAAADRDGDRRMPELVLSRAARRRCGQAGDGRHPDGQGVRRRADPVHPAARHRQPAQGHLRERLGEDLPADDRPHGRRHGSRDRGALPRAQGRAVQAVRARVGYVLGATDDDLVARSFYIDALAADRIAERAHALRTADERLTGHALGVEADQAEEKATGVDLLKDLAEILTGQGVDWMWNVAAVGALGTLRPDVWDGLNEASLGQLLAKRGVATRPLNRKDPLDPPGSPRRHLTGFELADVKAAQDARRGHLRPV